MLDDLGFALLVPTALLGVSVLVIFLGVRFEQRSGDRLRARRLEQPLAHELPYWTFLDEASVGVVVNVDLTYSSVLSLEGIDTDCADNEALNQVAVAIHGALQNTPAGVRLQFLHWSDGDISDFVARYRRRAAGGSELGRLVIEQKATDLLRSGNGLRRSHLLLAVSIPGPGAKVGGGFLGLGKKFPTVTGADHQDTTRRLCLVTDQLQRGFQAAGLGCRPLLAAEVRRVAYTFLNPRRARMVPDPFVEGAAKAWAAEQSAREQLLFAGLHEARDHLALDGQLTRVLTLKSLPTWTEPALLEGLLVGLPFHCRIALGIEFLDGVKAVDQLKRRRDQAHVLATLREKRNQEAEAQERDVEELIDKTLRSSVRMVKVALAVVLSVDSALPDAKLILERQSAEVTRLVASLHGAQMLVDEYAQLDEFLATLPGNVGHSRRWRQCTSENAAHLALAWQAWNGSDEPMVLLQNGRGHLVGLDPFASSLDNPNAFMAGASGSGKSATTNYLLLNAVAGGAKALIVDVGGSYRRVLEVFGGQYFAVSLESDRGLGLNPFFPHADIVGANGRPDEQRLQFVLTVLERMACDVHHPELGHHERNVLAAAVAETYERISTRTPILGDFVAVLREHSGTDEEDGRVAREIARTLRAWVEGPAARLVNRSSSIELTADLAAFDLKGLETHPQLRAVVMLILSGIIWNLVMRDPTERKLVVFDECWTFLDTPGSARLIAELYRTSRKYACSILTISQSVDDFTNSTIAGALVNNSATAYLLRHKRGHEAVAEQFHLNGREVHVFRGLEMRRGEFTEALVLHGDHHFLARVVLSPLEYWIATTHPADLELERRVRAEAPELGRLEVLRHLAARWPHGADATQPDAQAAA